MSRAIPLHNFSRDDAGSIAFKVVPLNYRTEYDTSEAHRHNYYEIFMFAEGGGTHEIDFRTLPIESNSIHFVSPGQVHHVRRELKSRGHVILFSRDFYYLNRQDRDILFEMPFLNNASPEPILNLDGSGYAFFADLAGRMEQEFGSGDGFSEDMIRNYLNIFLLECRRRYTGPEWDGKEDLFKRFRVALEENFREQHQVQDYAALLTVTEKQLNEAVRTATGQRAGDLIQDRVALEACRLLRHSPMSAKEIAFFLGFEDPSHFSRFFKRNRGVSPTEFRDVDS